MGIPNTPIKTCTCAGAHTHTYEHTLKEGDTYKQYGKREVDGIYALTHVHASVLAWNGTAGSVRIEKHERLRQQYRICPVTSQEHVHSAVRAYMLGEVRLVSSLLFASLLSPYDREDLFIAIFILGKTKEKHERSIKPRNLCLNFFLVRSVYGS